MALRFALDYPDDVAGLLLLAPSAYAEGMSPPPLHWLTETPLLDRLFMNLLLAPLVRVATAPFEAGLFAPETPPPGHVDAIAAFSTRPEHFQAFAEELRLLPDGLREQSSRYPEIRVPTIIMAGSEDEVDRPELQAERLHLAISSPQLLMLPGAGHAFHHAHASAVTTLSRTYSAASQPMPTGSVTPGSHKRRNQFDTQIYPIC